MSIDLHRERAYYLAHQDTLAQLYGGQFVVIKGDVVLGTYDDVAWAAPQSESRRAGADDTAERDALASRLRRVRVKSGGDLPD